jgi:hypothetical protein
MSENKDEMYEEENEQTMRSVKVVLLINMTKSAVKGLYLLVQRP